MTDTQKKAAISCFEMDKNLTEVQVTSDGDCFTDGNLLNNHVREAKLDKSKTATITRDDVMPKVEEPTSDNAVAKPFSKMNKAELLAEVAKHEGMTVPDGATNKDIVALLEEATKAKGGSDNE